MGENSESKNYSKFLWFLKKKKKIPPPPPSKISGYATAVTQTRKTF